MEIRRSDSEGLDRLGALWHSTPGAELEAMLTGLDLTGWQDVIQYLRSLGMRENPQLVKLNICLSNNIRLTLEGAGVIQAYCRDNQIKGKPFVAMLKEDIAEAVPVVLGAYAAKVKLKREIPLAADDERVKEVIGRWDQLGKHFRNIQRFEFVSPGGLPLRFDVSIVRENEGRPGRTFQEARVTTQPPRYEIEVELTGSRESTTASQAVSLVRRGLSWLIQGRQRSFVLVTNQTADTIRDMVSATFNGGGSGRGSNRGSNRGRGAPFRFPGPQPATLERKNIVSVPEAGVPNLRTLPGGYNVTDKADGLRALLFVSPTGFVFLLDGGGRVYATGLRVDPGAAGGTVLDGEWIRKNKKGVTVSHYYAFDILALKGDVSVAGQPFMIAGAMLGSAAAATTRQSAMASQVGILGSAAQTMRGVPATDSLQIGMKTFRACLSADIFQTGAAATLEDAKSAPYTTDGLIFTPNSAPLPLGRGTWYEQLKWKPSHDNTIDFLVLVERERGPKGEILAADLIGTKYREDSGQTVRFKTLRLFVGSSKDAAFADPRQTVLGEEPLPRTLDGGEWREVEFRPVDPRDPMASICYVAIGEGGGDPAGATRAATTLDADPTLIRTTRTGDVIQSDMIVEMAYHPERSAGWRWEPIRIRHDKTERWLAQQGAAPGMRKGGTMNADWVANSIWNTLHNPVTEDAVRTGIVTHCASAAPLVGAGSLGGGRRVSNRDLLKMQCMKNFHDHVKRLLLKSSILTPGASLCDLAMGTGEDLSKWITSSPSFVFGCDVQAAAINNPDDGAYRRLLNKMVELGGRDKVPPMLFAQADVGRSLRDGTAGATPEDTQLLTRVFTGPAATGFNVVSCMFALPYFFRDTNTVAGFLNNLADTVAVDGYFVGCCPDGDGIAKLLLGEDQTAVGRDGPVDIWSFTKRYGSGVGSSVPPSDAGLGLAVDVDLLAAGTTHTEYLVSWPYLQLRLGECGLELLTPEECGSLGLPAATQSFREAWIASEAMGEVFDMSEALKRLSFMNRWFVFKRRSDRRPAPPTALAAPAAGVTEALPLPSSEAAVLRRAAAGVAAATAGAAVLSAIPEGSADVIDLGEGPPAAPAVAVAAAAGPYLVDATVKTPDLRLGPELADWPRYLTLGMQPEGVVITDLSDPTIKYPSVEAAIASAKFQKAATGVGAAEMGPMLFREDGAIHQKYLAERMALASTGAPPEAIAKSIDDEVAAVRIASGAAKMKSRKVVWNIEAWTAQREAIYRGYLSKRFTADPRFRAILMAIKATGGEILFANGTEPSYLGVGVRIDGSIAGGENMVGKWLMSLVG